LSFRNKLKYKLVQTLKISNKEADLLILSGRIQINQSIVTENIPLTIFDKILIDKECIYPIVQPLFYKLYKPTGVECTLNPTISDGLLKYIPNNLPLFHIGRLDKASEGLLILTNIGQIHDSLLRNQTQAIWKKYLVKVDKVIATEWVEELENGVEILGQRTKPCKIEKLDDHTFYIWLNQGLNKQIRRMCKLFNLQVTYLKRTEFGEIQLQNMQAGDCIPFTSTEIAYLKQITLRNENNCI